MSDKVQVGIVGAGYVASRHLAALKSLPHVEIAAICDPDQRRAETLAEQFGVRRVYRQLAEMQAVKPQVVHILIPPASHCALALEALEMGADVFVEKPMAELPEECEAMMAKAREKGRVLSVNHSLLFEPAVERALRLLDSGAIGDLLSLTYFRGSDYPPYAGGPLTPVYSQGSYPFRDLGVHAIYLIERVMGPIRKLDVRYHSTGRNGLVTFDEWRLSAECDKGTAYSHLSWNARPPQNEFWIQGTKGVLHVDVFLQRCQVHRVYPGPKQLHFAINGFRHALAGMFEVPGYLLKTLTGRLKPSPGIYQSVIAFHEALRGGRQVPVDAADATRAVRWVADGSRAADEEKDKNERTRAAYRPKPARILVTGASGFVGSALVRRLCEAGERPRLLLRRAIPSSLQGFGLDVVQGDLGEPDAVARAVEGVDLVYHAGAGMRGGAREFEAGTVWGTRNVVDACVRYGVRRLVHVSSLGVLDVAGHAENVPVDERSAVEPYPERRGNYTKTKLEAERMVLAAVREHNLPAVIVRPGQIFGPGAERVAPSGVISFGSLWMVAGRGRRLLPLVFVEDVVSGLIAAAEAPDAPGRIVHLVDATRITQNEYLTHAAPALDGIRVWRTPEAILRGLALVCDGMSSILKRSLPLSSYRVASLRPLHPVDQAVAQEVLGWRPEVGLRRGLALTFGGERGGADHPVAVVPMAEPTPIVADPVEVERV